MFFSIILLVIVGLLWGATNPFIRLGSKGIDNIKTDSNKIKEFILEFKYLLTRWQYILPFILNQCGSIIYIVALQYTNLSIAVPISNSLTFVFTALTAHLLGENIATKYTYIGAFLIAVGSTLCLLDKVEN